jgi:hypothetical protein
MNAKKLVKPSNALAVLGLGDDFENIGAESKVVKSSKIASLG